MRPSGSPALPVALRCRARCSGERHPGALVLDGRTGPEVLHLDPASDRSTRPRRCAARCTARSAMRGRGAGSAPTRWPWRWGGAQLKPRLKPTLSMALSRLSSATGTPAAASSAAGPSESAPAPAGFAPGVARLSQRPVAGSWAEDRARVAGHCFSLGVGWLEAPGRLRSLPRREPGRQPRLWAGWGRSARPRPAPPGRRAAVVGRDPA